MSDPENELSAKIDGLSNIQKLPFKVVIGIMFGLSLSSAIARAAIRLRTRQGLSVDDYLLFVAALFLIATAGFAYYICDGLYLATAVRADSSLMFLIPADQMNRLINNAVQENAGSLILAWTTTFFVKFSFLAFFKQLIRQVDGIQIYYWAIVAFTIVTWLFLISEPFILCPHFGMESLKCFNPSQNTLYISMTGLITGLDALTDILIVSIPIIILRRARMRLRQKAALGTFLCLSLVMVVVAIIRVSKITGASGVDVPWSFFWQFMEASIAVLMASLTVFRTLLVSSTIGRNRAPNVPWPQAYTLRYRAYKMVGRKFDYDEVQQNLPEVPGATMTGLRTFIRRHDRDFNTTNLSLDTLCRDNTNQGDDQQSLPEQPVCENKQGSLEDSHAQKNEPNRFERGHPLAPANNTHFPSRRVNGGSSGWSSEQGTFVGGFSNATASPTSTALSR